MMPYKNKDIPEKAVALGYDINDKHKAPELLAIGEGDIASKIIAIAKEHGITIKKDADLVALLSTREIGDEIPVEAFVAVAEILRFIYDKNNMA